MMFYKTIVDPEMVQDGKLANWGITLDNLVVTKLDYLFGGVAFRTMLDLNLHNHIFHDLLVYPFEKYRRTRDKHLYAKDTYERDDDKSLVFP